MLFSGRPSGGAQGPGRPEGAYPALSRRICQSPCSRVGVQLCTPCTIPGERSLRGYRLQGDRPETRILSCRRPPSTRACFSAAARHPALQNRPSPGAGSCFSTTSPPQYSQYMGSAMTIHLKEGMVCGMINFSTEPRGWTTTQARAALVLS